VKPIVFVNVVGL